MHRHEVEPSDALTHTTMRHGADADLTPVAPDATAVFFGASYHADYATILAAPDDLPAVARRPRRVPRRAGRPACLGRRRPAPAALRRSGGRRARRRLRGARDRRGLDAQRRARGRLPGRDAPRRRRLDDYLATLGKKERHEIRRKVRRAEAVGEIRLDDSTDPLADLEAFIDLHQKRWGADGLFPPTRRAATRAASSSGACSSCAAPDGPLRLTFLTVGGRRIAAGIHFETADGYLYYNAGVDPDARDLSPGVVMVHAYVERALGRRRRAGWTSCAATSRTSTSGARWTSRSSACSSDVGTAEMTAPLPSDPCLEPVRPPGARPAAGDPRRRGPRDRHERRRPGAPLHARHPDRPAALRRVGRGAVGGERRPQAPARRASRCSSSTSPTTPSPSGALAAHLAEVRADVVHNHMYRAEIVGDAGGARARRGRPAPAVPRRDRPLEPHPLERGPAASCAT